MKFRDKLKQQHPHCVNSMYNGGCDGCPYMYGYESEDQSFTNCEKFGGKGCTYCWSREIPSVGVKRDAQNDAINPNYYNDTKVAPIDVIEDWNLGFCLGSTLKYIKRAGKKKDNSAIQDLNKVIWYVEREIKNLEESRND